MDDSGNESSDPPDNTQSQGTLYTVEGLGNETVYNPSIPVRDEGRQRLVARVEPLDSERDSQLMIFDKHDKVIVLDKQARIFKPAQDGRLFRVNGELVLTYVEAFSESSKKYLDALSYRTHIFTGKTLKDLKHFATTGDRVKDVIFNQLCDGRVFVSAKYEEGKPIGEGDTKWVKHLNYFIVDSIYDLRGLDLRGGREIFPSESDNVWYAIDAAFGLEEISPISGLPLLGLLLHRGSDVNDRKHYSEWVSISEQEIGDFLPPEEFVTRSDFPETPSKQIMDKPPDYVRDVIFCGGAERNGGVTMYFGISDCLPGEITRPDPFPSAAERFKSRLLEPAYS